MLSNSCLWLITLLLVVQGSKAQVQVDPVSCSALWTNMNQALDEAVAMAEFAYHRQIAIRDGRGINIPDWRVTINTFYAYFGRGPNSGYVRSGNVLVG